MTYRYLTNLADVCRKAGLRVVELDGWKTRGRPASTGGFDPVGILAHHTATRASSSDSSVLNLLKNGRSDLPGPLCQLGLGRDGTVYVVAAGRANHAGTARGSGTVAGGDGNSLYIGIEAFNDGVGEKWPAVQYDAYVKLAAALCREVTGNSAATVRGHKETSVTGKIDPTFDMHSFRERVDALLEKPSKPDPEPVPERPTVKVKAAHISMQFSDTPAQMRADAGRIFARAAKRRFWWVTGTEADTGMAKILREAAALHGFRFHRSRGEWVAVRKEHIKGGWKTGYVGALDSTEGRGRHSDRGVAWVAFDTADLGRITVGASHFLTDGRKPGQPNYELNERLTRVIGEWGKEHGKESALVFIHADANRDDRTTDVFSGQPFTSAADEMKAWKNTGHGPIDVIASYDKDKRVTAVRADVLNDDDFDLHTDHFFVVAVYEVRVISS